MEQARQGSINRQYRNALVRLRPRPRQQNVSQGRTVLQADENGVIPPDGPFGLFCHETRVLSRLQYLVRGRELHPAALSIVRQHSWLGYFAAMSPPYPPEDGGRESAGYEQHALELRVSRFVGDGMHEDLDLTNFTRRPAEFSFEVLFNADFADSSARSGKSKRIGSLRRQWSKSSDGAMLHIQYRARHNYDHQGDKGRTAIQRSMFAKIFNAGSPPQPTARGVRFKIALAPQESWHVCFEYSCEFEGRKLEPVHACYSFFEDETEHSRNEHHFLEESTNFRDPEDAPLLAVAINALERAKGDLAALRLHDLDVDLDSWTPAAGLPAYIALFGRDTLTAAWQSAVLSPEIMRGVLPVIANLQGSRDDPWRDEEPGRHIHEVHDGPLESLNFNPRGRYYGAITTSAFYPVVAAELWHWTGDRERVAPLIEPALKGLKWLDQRTDLLDNGFYSYKTRSTQGNKNQGWKDSGDSIVDEHGREIEPPIATCEEQGYVYAAKLQFAEVLWWFDRKEEALQLWQQCADLKSRFNEAFWMPQENFICLGLGPGNRKINSITSNPGHCIATGIVENERVRAVADRLFAPDLFTGWGHRTLSSNNPAYSPYSYHRGSVWPVEHGALAIGLMRYGLIDHLQRTARAIFETAQIFDFYRLPELFAGHQRDDQHPFPAMYARANSPQAWSASSLFAIVQALLGIFPYAPLKVLFVDPQLPEWLPRFRVNRLRVGDARVSLRFFRKADGSTDYEIVEMEGELHVLRQPSPWSLTSNFGERIKDLLASFLPAH